MVDSPLDKRQYTCALSKLALRILCHSTFAYVFRIHHRRDDTHSYFLQQVCPLPPCVLAHIRVYVYIPIGIYLFDRLVRTARYIFHNIRPGKATLIDYDDVTKIQVRSSRITSWRPGQHVLLCLPGIAFGQSHPATIASVPTSHNGDLVFFLRAHKGFTKKVLQYATKPTEKSGAEKLNDSGQTFLALIDGPYGGSHSDFAAFDTLVLIAGSTGVTFTLSILLDIAHRASLQKLPIRKILFVWVMKNIRCKEWVEAEISAAAAKLYGVGIDTDVQLFITCDTLLTEETGKCTGCECTTFPCCCTDTKLADPDRIEEIGQTSSETPIQRQISLCSARPDFNGLLGKCLDEAQGETAVTVCGPLGMSSAVRWTVAAASDARAVQKGSSAEGIYLHVECFGW
jgi:ferric-chelate reductase